MEANILTI